MCGRYQSGAPTRRRISPSSLVPSPGGQRIGLGRLVRIPVVVLQQSAEDEEGRRKGKRAVVAVGRGAEAGGGRRAGA